MNNQKKLSTANIIAVLVLFSLFIAYIAGGLYESGMNLFEWMDAFSGWVDTPYLLPWRRHTLKLFLFSVVLSFCGYFYLQSSKENRRPGEEYGSAKWGNPKELNQKYQDPKSENGNMILTKNVEMGLDGRVHKRNLNVLVVGGSGAGKTRSFCLPGILSANCSYLVTDPKGELCRKTGGLLEKNGYEVKVFDLINPNLSDCYNPFVYLHDEKDVLKLIDNLIRNTTEKNASGSDPFWTKAETALDCALILYLMNEAPPEEQNFSTMMYLLENLVVKEEDENYRSPVDLLFEVLEEEKPNHVALKQYKVFKQAAGKTAKSILITAAVRLAAFNLSQYAEMTNRDDLDLGSLGEKKQAIFCIIPVADSSMNYLIGMLYTQCFQELYYRADKYYNGRLPIPVRVIQDEWANVAQPDSYPKVLATCRSYNIGINIIVQNIASMKALYKDDWEGLIGNCDTILYLGGNEQGTHEYLSKMLGKETIDTRTRGLNRGRNGSSSTNYQQTGRELLTPDEVRMMDNQNAILFIRGERPVMDLKYDIKNHPNLKETEDGGAPPYEHSRKEKDYVLKDLPYEILNIDNIEFLEESEESDKNE